MIIDPQINKSKSAAQNWALMGDFIYTSKSIVKPVIYQEVKLTNEQRANRLLKQFSRFSNTLQNPEIYIAAQEFVVSRLNHLDEYEAIGNKNYTIDDVKNNILETIVRNTPLRLVR